MCNMQGLYLDFLAPKPKFTFRNLKKGAMEFHRNR